ncbi:MAG: hypothetical protein ABI410_20585 [Rhodoferax sp.]|uniref:hypothetical protein n=1 Tax=Rhodoferax sp. TaxID=50421 RepID=UPI003265ACF0
MVIQAELIADASYAPPPAISDAPAMDPAPTASAPPRPVHSPPATQPTAPEIPDVPITPQAPTTTGYLPIDAVDQPAMPLGDWVIDTDALPRGYTLRLVLQLWISAGGTIDHWDLVGDTANPVLAEKALAHLDQTPVRPALLNQVAVPSLRQLEVVVTRE